MILFLKVLNIFKIILGVPGSLIDVNVIPYTVLMLITWKEIESTGGAPIMNITIRYREIDDRISSGSEWNIIQIDSSKVILF